MLNALFDNPPSADVIDKLLLFTRSFYQKHGVNYDCRADYDSIQSALICARHSLRKLPTPSIFKKAAAFTHVFAIYSPITTELPADFYPPELKRRFYHNAVIAYEFCAASLHGATINSKKNDCVGDDLKRLDFKIKISKHQHGELMTALSEITELKDQYARLIALVYESLAYEFNVGVRYNDWPEDKIIEGNGVVIAPSVLKD